MENIILMFLNITYIYNTIVTIHNNAEVSQNVSQEYNLCKMNHARETFLQRKSLVHFISTY